MDCGMTHRTRYGHTRDNGSLGSLGSTSGGGARGNGKRGNGGAGERENGRIDEGNVRLSVGG